MLLFVTYQLWWTNVRADQQAGGAAQRPPGRLGRQQRQGDDPSAGRRFEPGEGFAILHIPKLDVVVPIAQGISKPKVLDQGMVGHYGEEPLKTAMPWDKTGNFALAGHRNTHGEPFRYINRLERGRQDRRGDAGRSTTSTRWRDPAVHLRRRNTSVIEPSRRARASPSRAATSR